MTGKSSFRAWALSGLTVLTLGVLAHVGSRPPLGDPSPTAVSHSSPARLSLSRNPATTSSEAVVALGRSLMPAALIPLAAGADPLTVEPRVPRAAGVPCVVDIASGARFESTLGDELPYAPPAACPGPWSKVILAVELTGPRPIGAPNANVHIVFNAPGGDGPYLGDVFVGAPQENASQRIWRLERDLTEYASTLRHPQTVSLMTVEDSKAYGDDDWLSTLARSVKLVFYPATRQTPAPRVADAVYAISSPSTLTLPRNVERAYLDIYAQATAPRRLWYSCVPKAAADAYPVLKSAFAIGDAHLTLGVAPQGCIGGSYQETEVRIDGRLAGLAPVFPWLPSNISNVLRDTVDDPAPGVQSLNFVPYRVDLTPFAALLSDGRQHTVQATVATAEPDYGSAFITGQLLVYLDHGRAQVTGAITRNTLAGHPAAPTVSDGLVLSGETLQGSIVTTSHRQYAIEGYVDTSHGRIRSLVWQDSKFSNTQDFLAKRSPAATEPYTDDYRQMIRMSNTVDRISRRSKGSIVLSEDREYVSFPLILDYRGAGRFEYPEGEERPHITPATISANVHQARGIRSTHYRRGFQRYDTSLSDVFDGRHTRKWRATDGSTVDSNWKSSRSYLFTDRYGSCYSAALTTASGALTSRTRGVYCPSGINGIHWFAHPDGSPDGVGWLGSR